MKTKPHLQENTIRLDENGTPFRIMRLFKKTVRICGEVGGLVSRPISEVEEWEEVEIPSTVRKGDILFYGKKKAEVTGFGHMGFGTYVDLKIEGGGESMWPASRSEFFAQMIYRRKEASHG